jgi:iron complex transport system substrate-binding protein
MKRAPALWLPVTVLSLLWGCSQPAEVAPERRGVITMAPHLTEAVFALGQGGRVIGVGSFDDYPPEIASLPKVGGYVDPNLEKIAMLSPELIIVPGKHRKVTDFAAAKGFEVLNVNMDSLAGIDAGIETIGKRLGCEKEADALRARIQNELAAVRNAVKGLPRPKVLIITMRQEHDLNNLYTANRTSFVSEIVDCAGGDNIYADAETNYPEASKETVVVKAPEVIIEFHAGEQLSPGEQAKYIADWRQLPSLPAVQKGRVCLITESYAVRPGPRVGEVARIVARKLHPEAAIPTP